MSLDIKNITISSAKKSFKEGDFSSVELTQSYLDCIKKQNKDINAFLGEFKDTLAQAKEADKRIKENKNVTELTGVPIAVKDNILVEGECATAGSQILKNYKAPYDATVIKKLKEAGAVLIGRTNLDEFAMGSSTENSSFGVVHNPVDLERVPGGSSGGSAAAVGMDASLVALGSDTGGSIRQPASFCGVVGLKPTYGAVSRYGLMAMGSSLDQIGPLGKNVSDVEVVFKTIKGHDNMDSTSLPESFWKNTEKESITIGVPRDFMKEGVDKDVLENFENSLKDLEKAGYKVVDVSLPNVSYSLAVYYIIMPAEASTNLARFDGVKYGLYKEGGTLLEDYLGTRREGFGPEVRRRILLGTYVLSSGYYDAYYNKANAVRSLITKDFQEAYEKVDVIATPTTPTPAFKIGEKSDPVSMYLSDIFTVPANLTGMPALSVPSGTVKRGEKDLPVGIQFIAPHTQEDILFRVGKDSLGER